MRLSFAIGVLLVASPSASLAQSPPDENAALARKICGEAKAFASSADFKPSFTAGGYEVQVRKDGAARVAQNGKVIANIAQTRDYAKCIEEVTRQLNARPPGPIDPGKLGR
jgi:hypothetical protein